jgi:hypothetical protein
MFYAVQESHLGDLRRRSEKVLVKAVDYIITKLTIAVPIKAVAQELGLPVHERDTFTGWDVSDSAPAA